MKPFFIINLSLILLFSIIFTGEIKAQAVEKYDSSLYSGIKWRQIGPFRGGRSATVCGVLNNPNLYYMGTAGGGVWKSIDGGNSWSCISDGYFGGSIGAVAVSESDPNVIYVGEGEQTVRGDVSSGWGCWKSEDAGKTWRKIGLEESEHISRIRIHPTDPNTVYVAAMGNLWKPNEQRGIFKSTDGGQTWKKVLFVSDRTAASDLVFDPNNPRIMYAGTWDIKRNGYRMDSGGPGSGLWKSTDGGETWSNLSKNQGLPKDVWGIVGVTVSPLNSNRIWTIIEALDGGVFRSDDGGLTWQKTNEDRALRQRAWYYSRIYADTQNEDMLYVMNVSYHRSKDAGKTFESFDAPHGDHHDLWIDSNNNQRMIIADDGGAQVSYDGGENWTTYHNQPTAQFYRVTTDNHFPYHILGAQQDNSTVRILHRSQESAITESDWESTAGGESAHLAPDPENPNIVYGGTYKGYMYRMDHTTGQVRSTNVWPDNPAGSGVEVMKYRFNWNFPVLFSPHDPDKLYACSNYVHVTTNEGQSWKVISPDLTRNDPETLRSSGGPITQDNTGVEFYGTIFAIAESKYEKDLIWTGSDDGVLYVTKDGGANWTNVTPQDAPRQIMWNSIDPDPFVKGGAYIAGTAYKFGDYRPYLFKTRDYGTTWTRIDNGIDVDHYTRVVRADPDRKGLLYAGTEWGMYISFDDGRSWSTFQLNLPIVSIRDLHIRDKALIAATHGRSFWIIDDLSPIHQLNKEIAEKEFHLFQPKPAYRMAQGGGWDSFNPKTEGENHPNGVMFHFFVKPEYKDSMMLFEILEKNGSMVQSFSSRAKDKKEKLNIEGIGNRHLWNLRYDGFKEFPGMVLYSSPNIGPKAIPGEYVARLIVGKDTSTQMLNIIKDPRLPNTEADYKKQLEFLLATRDKVSEAHQAIIDIRKIKDDLDYINSKIKDDVEKKDLSKEIALLKEKLEKIENNIHQTKNRSSQDALNYGIRINNRLAFLIADQQRGDFPPTDQAIEVKQEITGELNTQLADLDAVIQKDLPALSQKIQESGLSILQMPTKPSKP
jgi:photosystem II stability/assembly factor-like uncharacterized protein